MSRRRKKTTYLNNREKKNSEFTNNTPGGKGKVGYILPIFKITTCRNTLVCKGPRKGKPASS